MNHELFHFWNGGFARSSQQKNRPWLHEGRANYAALLASRERGTMTKERVVAALNRHLERCQAVLGNHDLRTHGPTRRRYLRVRRRPAMGDRHRAAQEHER